MPKSTITDLQQQIEVVRREAFAADSAAAMEAVRELASQSVPQADAAAAAPSRADVVEAAAEPTHRKRNPQHKAHPSPPNSRSHHYRYSHHRRPAATPTRRSTGRRSQRGTNALMIEEILKAAAPNALRPAEIRKALQDKGVAISFASIRHALGQLERRDATEQVGNSNT
jgi:hypothetical protein